MSKIISYTRLIYVFFYILINYYEKFIEYFVDYYEFHVFFTLYLFNLGIAKGHTCQCNMS